MSEVGGPKVARLAVLVSSPDEARRALEAGADYVLAPARRERSRIGVPDRIRDEGDDLLFAVGADESLPAEPKRIRRVRELGDVAEAGTSFAALLLDPGRPLLRAFSLEALSRHLDECRAAGIECWLGGALELPDVPRLGVLSPDALVVENLSPEALAQALAMLRRPEETLEDGPIDRIRVTNYVLHTHIGAYEFERERAQRVRFSVEASVRRPARRADTVGNVYSYDVILDAIRRLCERGHTDLVETLADELAEELLLDARLSDVTIRVEKLDLGPEAVGIEIHRRRKP
ncbi:dihydroneopterin aldolase [Aureimonas sp. ME7]|uniref:dihydroneopterin aldolase n=1 Tax=Aureimonas sp. ME7 TaxID=2744252 RepID=UPI0015F60BB2|nr:dihydroneopterin aldolase [Aureimonas sp. ME7]